MKTVTSKLLALKVALLTMLGIGVTVVGSNMLVNQKEGIKPFDSFSFLIGLSGFGFSVYQVVKEAGDSEAERLTLLSLLEIADRNIQRVQRSKLEQESPLNVNSLLLGILQQEREHIRGLLQSRHSQFNMELQEPSIELIEGQNTVRAILQEITRNAEDFIYIVGGRSRDEQYLESLLKRIRQGDIDYMRIVTGGYIHLPLLNHLKEIENLKQQKTNCRTRVCYLKEDMYGSFLVTRNSVFWALPSSTQDQLTTGVHICDPKVASDFRAHIVDLSAGQRTHTDIKFFEEICIDLSTNNIQSNISLSTTNLPPSGGTV